MKIDDVVAKQDLYELACRYCQAVDRKNFKLLEQLYHPEAIHDHGSLFVGNPSELIAWLGKSMKSITTQHFLCNHLFSVNEEHATGELYAINYHVLHGDGADRDYIAGGRYFDEYVRYGGGWRIWRRKRVIDWSHDRPTSASVLAAKVQQSSQ